jgi:hypothetical protein
LTLGQLAAGSGLRALRHTPSAPNFEKRRRFPAPQRCATNRNGMSPTVEENSVKWLGWEDSNLRMAVPKTAALPLGYTPTRKRVHIAVARRFQAPVPWPTKHPAGARVRALERLPHVLVGTFAGAAIPECANLRTTCGSVIRRARERQGACAIGPGGPDPDRSERSAAW